MERIEPGPGQESVWDYPRPPALEQAENHVRVEVEGIIIADSANAKRVLETSHPPVYYIPPTDIEMQYLQPASSTSYCEWKGTARYHNLKINGRLIEKAAWSYADPSPRFKSIKNHVAFYPHKMDACYVNDEQVRAQAGSFYGGWITDDIMGPFKGAPGTMGW